MTLTLELVEQVVRETLEAKVLAEGHYLSALDCTGVACHVRLTLEQLTDYEREPS
jgi:hypothetical protein